MNDKLYNLQEVADILRVSERSVFRYIVSGQLKATKIGYWRVSESDLRAFLKENANIPSKFTFGNIVIHSFNGNAQSSEYSAPKKKKPKSKSKSKKKKK